MQYLIEALIKESLSEEEFITQYPAAALIFAIDKNNLDSTTSIALRNIKPDNAVVTPHDTQPLPVPSKAIIDEGTGTLSLLFSYDIEENPKENSIARVVFLTKSNRNNNSSITLGRDINNDIIIDMPSISKFHTQFLQKDQQWMCMDVKSLNGTEIDKKSLIPHSPVLLQDNSQIILGSSISCRFYTPKGLWAYLRYFEGMKHQFVDYFDV